MDAKPITPLIRDHLLPRLARTSPWTLFDVAFALRKDAVEESLAAHGLEAWAPPVLKTHAQALEAALAVAEDGVLVLSGPERVAFLPFAVRGAAIEWTPEPPDRYGPHVGGRYRPPEGLRAVPAPAALELAPVTIDPTLEDPAPVYVYHPWDQVAIATGNQFVRERFPDVSPDESADRLEGVVYLPEQPSLEAARRQVQITASHAWPSGRTDAPPSFREGLLEREEAIARALLRGPKVALAWGGAFYLLDPLIEPPERARIYSPGSFGLLAGAGTLSDLMAYLFESGAYDRDRVRFAVLVRPGDPALEAKQAFLLERFPESAAARGLAALADKEASYAVLDLGDDFAVLRVQRHIPATDWREEIWLAPEEAQA